MADSTTTTQTEDEVSLIKVLRTDLQQLRDELHHVIVGMDDVIDQLLISLLCRGHCILEGVPGLAKTLMISTVSSMLGLSFCRI